jgi:hypothetical protein
VQEDGVKLRMMLNGVRRHIKDAEVYRMINI